MKKLVSILTPCYNGERYIQRLLNSILNQTYSFIEMFVIDDGSTDNSAKLIQSYIPIFEAKGYSLTYIYQENSGQSVAINNGLKVISGDYLVWPDSDDWYATDNAIMKMVETLDNSDDSVSMVRCQYYLLDESSLEKIGTYQANEQTKGRTDLFLDCLFDLNGFWYTPGGYMAKTKKIEECISHKEIYTNKDAGQNWQLMLPLLYNSKCLTIDEFMYNYLVRKDSHSRGQYVTMSQKCQRYIVYENTILNTIDNIVKMADTEKDKYKKQIRLKYRKIRVKSVLKHLRHLFKYLVNRSSSIFKR